MRFPFFSRIVVDGNDGTGKSTLVAQLKKMGFTRVEDRGEMTKATDDDSAAPVPETIYILLHCSWNLSHKRLLESGADMNDKYHEPQTLEYYSKRFLEISDKFKPISIDVESLSKQEVLESLLIKLGKKSLFRIGIPSGRLSLSSLYNLLPMLPEKTFHKMEASSRKLSWEEPPFLFLRGRTSAYPKLVAFGELDLAICGSDVLDESNFLEHLEVLDSIPQPDVSLVLASISGKIPQKRLLRIATKFKNIAHEYFGSRGIPHTIFGLDGSTEGLLPHFADVILEITETGESLKKNGLEIIENLGSLKTCLIRRRIQ